MIKFYRSQHNLPPGQEGLSYYTTHGSGLDASEFKKLPKQKKIYDLEP